MYAEVKDLKKGDEILYPSGSNLVHAILLRNPEKRANDSRYYKNVKCSVCAKIIEYDRSLYDWKTKTWYNKKFKRTVYETDIIDGSRIDKFVDLNYKKTWLLNR